MPTLADAVQFFGGQFFGSTTVPSVDLTGKTIVITGGNTGLGFECAKHLAQSNVTRLILGCRDLTKGEAARTEILKYSSPESEIQVEVWQIDLSDHQSVVAFGRRLDSDVPRLDGFIANAGVEMQTFEKAEELELSLTVNVISTFMSALAALKPLRRTSAEFNVRTNLVLVGSLIHTFAEDTQLEYPEGTDVFKALSDPLTAEMYDRYPLTKLIQHLCFQGLVEKIAGSSHSSEQVVINLVSPGWCRTELSRNKANQSLPERVLAPYVARTAEQGSRCLVHGVTAGMETNGRYLSECQIKPQSSYVRSNAGKEMQKVLWGQMMDRIEKASPELVNFT